MAFVAGYDLEQTAKAGVTESSGDVTGWTDQVTGTRELTVPTGQSSPRIGDVTLNGFNVLTFDGTDGGATLQIDDGQGSREPSAGNYMYSYLLIRTSYPSSTNYILDAGNAINREAARFGDSENITLLAGGNQNSYTLTGTSGDWMVLTFQFTDETDETKVFLDGTEVGFADIGASAGDGLTVGARQDFFGEGAFDVAHIVEYYDVAQHSSADIQQNVDELRSEWGFTYSLTITNSPDAGTVTQDPDKENYDDGEQVELTADPDAGWQFDSWSGDITSTSNPVTVTMDADKSITANYIETQLISPEDGATGVSQTPTLDWRDLAGYSDYNVQIATDSGFTNIIHDVIVEGASQYDVPSGVLDSSTTYYWRRYGVRVNFDSTLYSEDFNVQAKSGWLDPWTTQSLRANAVSFDIANGEAVIDVPNADSLGVADLDGIDVDNSIIQFKFTLSDIADSFQPTFHFRTSGAWANEQKTGYWIWFYQGDLYLGHTNSNHNNSTITNVSKTLTGGTQYTVKIDINNTVIRVRVWESAQSEPSTWDIDVVDDKHATGRLALKIVETANGTGSKDIAFDDFDISPQESTPTITQINGLDGELEVYYDGVTEADSYEVQLDSDDPINVSTLNPFVVGNGTLTNGQTYDVRMRAIIDGTAGAWSETKQGTPTAGSVESVTINEGDFTISEGQTFQLTTTVETTGGADETVTWSSSDTAVATVDSNGKVTGESDGSCIITATSTVDGDKSDSVTATIEAVSGGTSGDIAALEAIYVATNGDNWTTNTDWAASGMSLSPAPYGVTVETINGEDRVTAIDLSDNNLTSDIDTPELGNLTRMKLFCVYLNNLNSALPTALDQCGLLEYVYLCGSDNVVDIGSSFPHEIASTGGGDVHPGKTKGGEGNVFTGAVPTSYNKTNWPNLKWLMINWTDTSLSQLDGIGSAPDEIFDFGSSIEGLHLAQNHNVASRQLPAAIGNNTNLEQLALYVRPEANITGWLTGSMPTEFSNCVSMKFPRFSRHENFTIDFDVNDFSNMTNLKYINASFCDTVGSLQSYFFDGTLSDFIQFTVNWPTGSGMSGNLDTALASLNVNLEVLGLANHSFTGDIPASIDKWHMILLSLQYNDFSGFETNDWTSMLQIRNVRLNNNPNLSGKWPYFDWGDVNAFSRFYAQGCDFSSADKNYVPPNSPDGTSTTKELIQAEVDEFND